MPDQKLFVISLRCGRLANRLILFANFIALAEEHGWRVSNVTFHSYAAFFKATHRDIYCRYPVAERKSPLDLIPGVAATIRKTRIFNHAVRAASLWHARLLIFGKSAVTLRESPGRNVLNLEGGQFQNQIRDARIVFVHGWKFRALDLVERHAEKIRNYFQPLDEFEEPAAGVIAQLRREADIVAGVHIRQGDYRRWLGGRYFFPVTRYAAWMQELAAQFPGQRVSFFVCSDEPRNTEEFPGLSTAFGKSPVNDLCALAKCDYIVGPVSTFSQWASFYGQKPLLHLRGSGDKIDLEKFRVSNLDYVT
ncbi:MAG: alpha-1,2-fucosyltransferase [Limisphaerales bacterium]